MRSLGHPHVVGFFRSPRCVALLKVNKEKFPHMISRLQQEVTPRRNSFRPSTEYFSLRFKMNRWDEGSPRDFLLWWFSTKTEFKVDTESSLFGVPDNLESLSPDQHPQ
jgi:hypothetical protein